MRGLALLLCTFASKYYVECGLPLDALEARRAAALKLEKAK